MNFRLMAISFRQFGKISHTFIVDVELNYIANYLKFPNLLIDES